MANPGQTTLGAAAPPETRSLDELRGAAAECRACDPWKSGIDRDLVYVTNVVKHFKWRPRGKRRIHQKPNSEEIRSPRGSPPPCTPPRSCARARTRTNGSR